MCIRDRYINISYNDALQNLNGLAQLQTIEEYLTISHNDALQNLNGLAQLQTIEENLTISNNKALSDCSTLCAILNTGTINGTVSISNNPSECNSPTEVRILCSTNECPSGNFDLRTQNEVDAFIKKYANCTTIDGNLKIRGSITDLSGLSFLNTITGELNIESNNRLTTLDGLQNITSIGTNLRIYFATALTDLTGIKGNVLQQLDGYILIQYNTALQNLSLIHI